MDLVANDSHEDVRATTLRAMIKFFAKDENLLPLLRERAENDPTPWLREKAKQFADEIEAKRKNQ